MTDVEWGLDENNDYEQHTSKETKMKKGEGGGGLLCMRHSISFF